MGNQNTDQRNSPARGSPPGSQFEATPALGALQMSALSRNLLPAGPAWVIPEISDAALSERMKQVHALRRDREDNLRLVPAHDPRTEAFSMVEGHSDGVRGLREVARITTYHSTGYAMFFKPSIAEVLAQIPPQLFGTGICAFETIPAPHNHLTEIMDSSQSIHRAETILYIPTDDEMQRFVVDEGAMHAREVARFKRYRAPSAAELDGRFSETALVVKADPYEHLSIWKRFHQELRLAWVDDPSGVACAIGYREAMPIMATFRWASIEGQRVLFVQSESLVSDAGMLDQWLESNCNPTLPNGNRATLSAAQFADVKSAPSNADFVEALGDHSDSRFAETFYAVEASPFAQRALRNEFLNDGISSWEEDPNPIRVNIGRLDGSPVDMQCNFAVLDGKRILFYSNATPLCHHGLEIAWLRAHCPQISAKGRNAHDNAMNFVSCLHAVDTANKEDA